MMPNVLSVPNATGVANVLTVGLQNMPKKLLGVPTKTLSVPYTNRCTKRKVCPSELYVLKLTGNDAQYTKR